MKHRLEIIKHIGVFLLVFGVALQTWRGFFLNGCNITKSLIQLSDMKQTYSSLHAQNKIMFEEVKQIKAGNDKKRQLANTELNMVSDPAAEVVIQFLN
ncbi:MAG: hypothetical protein QNJ31_01305 [Candidatus Caenarcaniphilales bacterium]|nr:hypothetical protein [Candidatus Caenarcaniphilales bacterium]